MSKVFTVVRKEYLERVRSKSFLIGTLLGPALMSMLVVLPVMLSETGGEDARTLGIVDDARKCVTMDAKRSGNLLLQAYLFVG